MEYPKQSYRIWFSQRTGSTLLCKGLEQTGVAGKPGEFFNIFTAGSLSEKYGARSFSELKEKIWKEGTTENGIFGIKHSYHTDRSKPLFQELQTLQGRANEPLSSEEIVAPLFPNCKHIYLTRRNKIRQAVSWWKAIKDEVWHLELGQSQKEAAAFYKDHYDFDALMHLFKEATLKECATQAYFDQFDIRPLTIVYEDMIKDFQGTLQQVLAYLEIEATGVQLPNKYLQKTATDLSEQWVQRFRKDMQANMDLQIW